MYLYVFICIYMYLYVFICIYMYLYIFMNVHEYLLELVSAGLSFQTVPYSTCMSK